MIQALMYIMYKLFQGGPSCEAYANKLKHLFQYPLVGVSERKYQIQLIYEYIFLFRFTRLARSVTLLHDHEMSQIYLSRGLIFFLP